MVETELTINTIEAGTIIISILEILLPVNGLLHAAIRADALGRAVT